MADETKKKTLLNENGEQLLYKPVGRLGNPAAAPAQLNNTDVSGVPRPAAPGPQPPALGPSHRPWASLAAHIAVIKRVIAS